MAGITVLGLAVTASTRGGEGSPSEYAFIPLTIRISILVPSLAVYAGMPDDDAKPKLAPVTAAAKPRDQR